MSNGSVGEVGSLQAQEPGPGPQNTENTGMQRGLRNPQMNTGYRIALSFPTELDGKIVTEETTHFGVGHSNAGKTKLEAPSLLARMPSARRGCGENSSLTVTQSSEKTCLKK